MTKNNRSSRKYPGLATETTLPIRTDILDYDYIDKLSDKEKEWLNRFSEEWIHANLNHSGKKFHKKREDRKIINDRNNARNRDIYSRTKIRKLLK